jgi:predicted permease
MNERLRMLRARAASWFTSRGRLDAELDDELRAHLDLLADEHRQGGLSRTEARAAALRDFGGVAQITEVYRDQRGIPFLDALAQDVRYALRMWRRAPGFSAVVIAVLALGIGANTAMFTIVNALLFRPLSGRAAELLGVYSHERTKPDSYRGFSYPNYVDLRDRGDVFDGLMAHAFTLVGLPAGDTTRRAFVEVVSSNFFSTLGVSPAAGRTFTPEEERPGAQIPVVIVRYDYWKQAGFDPAVLGRTLHVNAQDFTIVGIAPEGFAGTTALFGPELWIPLGMFDTVVNDIFKNKGTGLGDRSNAGLLVAGRVKPGVTADAANARLDPVSRQLEDAYPDANRDQVISVHPLSRISLSTAPQSDLPVAIAGAVVMPLSGAVLLIACLNIANMFLARGSARRKEMAIRLAIGGGRWRIVRQLLTEGFLLALAGAAGGLVLGAWTTRVLATSLAAVLPLELHLDPRPDLNILLAATGCAVASTLAFALAPALTISRPDVVTDLKDVGGDTAPTGRLGTRAWLVVGQIAVSLVLMAIGGSVALGAIRAADADPGFRYDGLLLVSTDASMAGYDEARGEAALRTVLDRIRRLPGVVAAGMASLVPFGDSHEGRPVERLGTPDTERRSPTFTLIGTDYFKALGLPLLRGREFSEAEVSSKDGPRVAIVDERFARRFFPGEDPIGQQIRMVRDEKSRRAGEAIEIVGVVPTVQDELLERTPDAHLYVPAGSEYRANMFIHVRTAPGYEGALAKLLRREIQDVDSRLPLLQLTPMRRFHDRGLILWLIRAAGSLLSAFGILALSLAAIGVYGVKSYVVAQRTREIGIRLALGARPANIMWMVLRDGGRMTAIGLTIGLPIAVAIAVALGRLTNGVLTVAPLALAFAPVVLALAAALATYVPAHRAMRITPLNALRAE